MTWLMRACSTSIPPATVVGGSVWLAQSFSATAVAWGSGEVRGLQMEYPHHARCLDHCRRSYTRVLSSLWVHARVARPSARAPSRPDEWTAMATSIRVRNRTGGDGANYSAAATSSDADSVASADSAAAADSAVLADPAAANPNAFEAHGHLSAKGDVCFFHRNRACYGVTTDMTRQRHRSRAPAHSGIARRPPRLLSAGACLDSFSRRQSRQG